jgi:hypothetical protein
MLIDLADLKKWKFDPYTSIFTVVISPIAVYLAKILVKHLKTFELMVFTFAYWIFVRSIYLVRAYLALINVGFQPTMSRLTMSFIVAGPALRRTAKYIFHLRSSM